MRGASALMLALALLLGVPAAAQPAGSGSAQEAVRLGKQAKEKYDQGDWAAALTLFEAAEASAHSPVLLLYAARCHRNLGKLVRARDTFQRVVDEALPATAPEPQRAAQRDARADLDALLPRLATLVVDRTKAPGAWLLEIDGAPAKLDASGAVTLDPGAHTVVARDGSEEKFKAEISLAEGGKASVVVDGGPPAPAVVAPAPPPKTALPVDEPPPADGAAYAPGAVLLAVGAGGLAAAIGTRVVAFQKVEDVKARCSGSRCLASDLEEIESAETLQTVSTVCFAAGGALALTGVILLVVLPQQAQATVSLDVGPGSLSVRGSF